MVLVDLLVAIEAAVDLEGFRDDLFTANEVSLCPVKKEPDYYEHTNNGLRTQQ